MSPQKSLARRIFKAVGYLLAVVVVIVAGLVIYIKTALPNVGRAPDLHVALTPEKIERGRYLANSICVCMDCHSTRDWSKFAGPIKKGTLGRGGERFDQSAGFPGTFFSRNITPAGISQYTDGELFRVITAGVDRTGRAMFPVMPYKHYGRMDTADITSIISYIRSLKPINNDVPASRADFPVSIILNTIPEKAHPETKPSASDTLAYGRYLVNASGCIECHTPAKQGKILEELAFSGGREFKFPSGAVIRSVNITFDKATGIGNWTPEFFVEKFKAYADSSYRSLALLPTDINTVMPWMMYSNMTESDLRSIYAYLKSLPPQKSHVH